MPNLLYEIGIEQLPAAYLEPGLDQLRDRTEELLQEHRLETEEVHACGTPRRMTVVASEVPEQQEEAVEEVVGPPAHVAFDDDENPTEAAEGFARSQGVAVEDLRVEDTEKGPYVVAERREEGNPATEVLPDILLEATRSVTFPKSMRWTSDGVDFARPIRWLVALLDEQELDLTINSVDAGRESRGHMFLSPEPFPLPKADYSTYRDELAERHVIVEPDERRQIVREQIREMLEAEGHTFREDGLLNEVANMVEYPCAAEGEFDPGYLEVPDPVLAAAMTEHQRYFPVYDEHGSLVSMFVSVVDRTEDEAETVIRGNERVLRARLEDARFFWNKDRETTLEDRVPELADVVFLQELGSDLDRAERLERACAELAGKVEMAEREARDCRRAARLCKADLLTELVDEFPSLQGVVGRELALEHGENESVAEAIAGHYHPNAADDPLPERLESRVLALADRLDMLVGCFALGLEPTGSKDPYALRRQARAALRLLETSQLDLPRSGVVEVVRRGYEEQETEVEEERLDALQEFLRDRLYHMALDRGHSHDYIRAVLAAGSDNVADFWARLQALELCAEREWWPSLVELVDRTYRIQKNADDLPDCDPDLLEQEEERKVWNALDQHRNEIQMAFDEANYREAAELYCRELSDSVHVFFDEVFVNVDDEALRDNRKALCRQIHRLFADNFADLYRLEEE